jgi:hypothetical protein
MLGADSVHMAPTTRTYRAGPAADFDRERPSLADLQRAAGHALRRGDRRRAAAYALIVEHRVREAQRAAEAA